MQYCSECGKTVIQAIPKGDNRLRYVCPHCHTIHYQNPKVITGCIPVWEDKILLCQRAISPQQGFWTLPAGFMELNESIDQAAQRETFEEANATMREQHLYLIFSIPHIGHINIFFYGQLAHLDFFPGEESYATELFNEQNIPWDQLAFPSIKLALELFFQDQKQQHFPVRHKILIPPVISSQA